MSEHTTSSTEAESAKDFRLVAREWQKDDGRYVATETAYSRREWWENGPGPRDAWSMLASQQADDRDFSSRDAELVLIRVMGYFVNDADDWAPLMDMGGFDGPEWTLAALPRYDDVDGCPGPDGMPEPSEWAHDPVHKGSRKAAYFSAVKGDNRWRSGRYGFSYPKAAGLVVVRPEGSPTDIDREPLRNRDGYPTEDGRLDRSAEWSFDRAMTAARERVEDRRREEQHEVQHGLDQLLEDTDLSGDAGGHLGARALEGRREGSDRYRELHGSHDDRTKDALWSASVGALRSLVESIPAEDRDAFEEILERAADQQ